ncbi:hypothetical protein KEM55_002405, partial [Ascosphaera atra]
HLDRLHLYLLKARTSRLVTRINTVVYDNRAGPKAETVEEVSDDESEEEEEEPKPTPDRETVEAMVCALEQKHKAETSLPSIETHKQGRYHEPIPNDDEAMDDVYVIGDWLDIEATAKPKATVRKTGSQQPKLAQKVKETSSLKTVLNRLFSNRVEISLQKLLGLSPKVHRSVFSTLPKEYSGLPVRLCVVGGGVDQLNMARFIWLPI